MLDGTKRLQDTTLRRLKKRQRKITHDCMDALHKRRGPDAPEMKKMRQRNFTHDCMDALHKRRGSDAPAETPVRVKDHATPPVAA